MSEEEIRKWWRPTLIFTASSVLTLVLVIAIIIGGSMKFSDNTDLLNQATRNHDAAVCYVAVQHTVSLASGKSAEEREADFGRVFTPEWLKNNCTFTDEEIKKILDS